MVFEMRLWRVIARYLSGQPGFQPGLFQSRQRLLHFLARVLFLALRDRVLQLVHRFRDGPLQRERRGRDGQGLLVVERGVPLNVGRRDEVEELPMGHRAERRGPLSPIRTEDVVNSRAATEHLDAKHRTDALGTDNRGAGKSLLNPADVYGQGVRIDGRRFRLVARRRRRVLLLLCRRGPGTAERQRHHYHRVSRKPHQIPG